MELKVKLEEIRDVMAAEWEIATKKTRKKNDPPLDKSTVILIIFNILYFKTFS